MANTEEEICLLPKDSGKSNGYGTQGSSSHHNTIETKKSISSIDALLNCSSKYDKIVLVLGGLLALLSACFDPINIFITVLPYRAALPYMLYLFGLVAVRVTGRLRYKYLDHILGMDMSLSQTTSVGELTAMLDENMNKICDVLENNLPQAIYSATQIVCTILVVTIIRWDIGILMLCFIIPAVGLFYFGTKFRINMVAREQYWLSKAAEIATECFVCIKTVICFNGQEQTIQRYNNMVARAMVISRKTVVRAALIDAFRTLVIDALIAVAVFYASYYLDQTEPFLLLAMLEMVILIGTSIPMLNVHFNAIVQAVGSAQIINQILTLEPEIELPSGDTLEAIGPNIVIQNLSFAYPSRPDMLVIDNVSLHISPGEKVAIVGESGSGKSTIVALLMRFFDSDHGSISIDGHNIKSLNVNWLRSQFGLVTQEPALFDMTIRENLLCGKPDATEQDLTKALLQSNAMEFIINMPKGMETRVGERGTQLSGGQKQRLAIARSLLKDPSMLIFDEATSSLDSHSEALVQSAIDRASLGRTTITIAHRLSTILNSHRIIVMKDGKIVDEGTPVELMNKQGIFRHLLKVKWSCVYSICVHAMI